MTRKSPLAALLAVSLCAFAGVSAASGCSGSSATPASDSDGGAPSKTGTPGGPSSISPDGAPSSIANPGPDGGETLESGANVSFDGGDAGTATCGCNGMAACAVWTKVYMTFYGFNDNSCTVESQHDCNDIAYPGLGPKKHQVATEGVGTYDDPITAAASDQGSETAGGATLSPGTIIYNPEVQKYFIMEDSCLECGDEWKCHLSSDDKDDPPPPAGCVASTYLHIDFWMGPSFQQDATTLNDCEDNSTFGDAYKGVGTVVVNPPPNLPVKTALLYTGADAGGGCWTSTQVAGDSCP